MRDTEVEEEEEEECGLKNTRTCPRTGSEVQ